MNGSQIPAREGCSRPNPAKKGFRALLGRRVTGLPRHRIVSLGRRLGTVVWALDWRHRRTVCSNLQFCHPDWSPYRVRNVCRRVFQSLFLTLLETLQMGFFSRSDFMEQVPIRGKEHLLEASASPQGAIIISAHLGNWEMAFLAGSCYFDEPVVAVARQIRPRLLNRWMVKSRSRFGNSILDKRGALPKMVRLLRQGRTLGILIDQETVRADGVKVQFFGRDATATPAAALLARRYGCPVLPAYCVRGSRDELVLMVEPPLALRKSDDPRADLAFNTQLMTTALERAIRAHEDQWFWVHRRWKRYYPNLYPEHMAKRQRRKERRLAVLEKRLGRQGDGN